MNDQPFDIEQTLKFGNEYGEEIVNHIQELSDSIYQILRIDSTDDYLKFAVFLKRGRAIGEENFLKLVDQLYFPFAIHILEAFRKKINGNWKTITDGNYKIPCITKDSKRYLSNDIFESYKNNFQNEVRSIEC